MIETVRSRLELAPTALATREIGGWLAESLSVLPERTASAVLSRAELAVHEACMNIIEHGRLPDGGIIELRLELSPGQLLVRLLDRGVAFDPVQAPVPATDPLRERGYGLIIIRSLAEVSYRRVETVNELELRMEIGEEDAR